VTTSPCATSFPTHGASQSTRPLFFPVCFLVLMLKFAPLIYFVTVVLDLDCGKRGVCFPFFLSYGEI
jgi:hypothetical protein